MKSIYSLGVIVCLAAGLSCSGPPDIDEKPASDSKAMLSDPRGFDPLELGRDREVVPQKYPRTGEIAGKQAIVEADPQDDADSSGSIVVKPPLEIDSLNNQVYRVQIFTSRVYGDARKAARVAEEIFDQVVYVDYQVPNYKVRVGSFADRDGAEVYQQKVRAAGYSSAWVVSMSIGVKELAPLYGDDTDLFLPGPEIRVDSVATNEEEGSDSED